MLIFTELATLVHLRTGEQFGSWGQKVKVQGHGEIKYAGNSTLTVVVHSTGRLTSSYGFWLR